jgi:hypothetical protein
MSLTAAVFLVVYFLGLAAILVNPLFGVFTYLWSFYLSPGDHWWGTVLPDIRWQLIAAIITLMVLALRPSAGNRRSWLATPPARILLVFVSYMWLQCLWVAETDLQIEGAILFSKHLAVYFIVYQVINSEGRLRWFALAHIGGCFFLGWQAFGSGGRLSEVGGSLAGNELAMHMGTGLIFAAYLILLDRGWMRWVSIAAIPIILNCVILLQSRGNFLGLLVAGAAAWYLSPRSIRPAFFGAACLGLVLTGLLANEEYWTRVVSIAAAFDETAQVDNSAASRVGIAQAGWEIAKDHPWGAGYRATGVLSPTYMDESLLGKSGIRTAHNSLMAVLAEEGFPGAALYFVMIIAVALMLRRFKALDKLGLPRPFGIWRAVLGASLTLSLVSGQFSNFSQAEVQYWCLSLLASALYLAESAVRNLAATASASTESAAETPRIEPAQSGAFDMKPIARVAPLDDDARNPKTL